MFGGVSESVDEGIQYNNRPKYIWKRNNVCFSFDHKIVPPTLLPFLTKNKTLYTYSQSFILPPNAQSVHLSMICTPLLVSTIPLTPPTGSANAASLNSFLILPYSKGPRSPPLLAELQSLSSVAVALKTSKS